MIEKSAGVIKKEWSRKKREDDGNLEEKDEQGGLER